MIILLQFAFTIFVLVIVSVAFTYLYFDMSKSLIEGIEQALTTQKHLETGALLAEQMDQLRMQNLLLVGSLIVFFSAVFGFVIGRIALKPTRDALASQKQFIGNIAHELRTPLSIIKTNTEVALLDQQHAEKMKRMFRSNIEELDRASDIINNLLSLNTLISPERVEFSTVDLGTVVSTIMIKLAKLAAQREIIISLRKSDFRIVLGNTTALEQIVMNLLKNAIIYTPPGGTINVTIAPNYHGFIELTVTDTGVGIAKNDLLRVFEPFYRADQSRKRRQTGSGLGLTIVSELVKMHHGKVSIRSILKQGTTVSVSLPCVTEKESGAIEHGKGKERKDDEVSVDFSHG